MSRQTNQEKHKNKIKAVAIPTEHGGWGFIMESILLGLLVAFSSYGLLLAISALSGFLLHQPLKVAAKDRLKGRRYERTALAEKFALGYGSVMIITFMIVFFNVDTLFVLPFLVAAPLGVWQLYHSVRNTNRKLMSELFGATALGSIAPAIAIIGGYELAPALLLWLILAARTIPSILYVRARLRLEKKQPATANTWLWSVHIASVFGVGIFVYIERAPWLAFLAILILMGRMALGLSKYRKPRQTKSIGMQELAYGVLTVVLVAIGYAESL
jgi:hypothetical protein